MAIDLEKIIQTIQSGDAPKLPPVHLWQPDVVGEMDLQIDKHQQWFHEGAAFKRQSLVKLLSSVMRLDDGEYYLVTPTEKMRITVEDVPFSIVSMLDDFDDKQALQRGGVNRQALVLLTNTEQIIRLDKDCQWQLRDFDGVSIPYVEVRAGLWARVTRAVFYQMAERAEVKDNQLLLISADCEFVLGATG